MHKCNLLNEIKWGEMSEVETDPCTYSAQKFLFFFAYWSWDNIVTIVAQIKPCIYAHAAFISSTDRRRCAIWATCSYLSLSMLWTRDSSRGISRKRHWLVSRTHVTNENQQPGINFNMATWCFYLSLPYLRLIFGRFMFYYVDPNDEDDKK